MAETTKKAAAPTALLFAPRTGHTEMKLTTVTEMVAPWPATTNSFAATAANRETDEEWEDSNE